MTRRAEVLDDEIRFSSQPPNDLPSALRLEVERDAALVGVEVEEEQAVIGVVGVVVEGRHTSCGIASVGTLHLHHVRPEVGQELGTVGPGDMMRKIEDSYAFQSAGGHDRTSTLGCPVSTGRVHYTCAERLP